MPWETGDIARRWLLLASERKKTLILETRNISFGANFNANTKYDIHARFMLLLPQSVVYVIPPTHTYR